MTFGAVFPRVMRPTFGPGLAGAADAANWWEAGGASGCVAAWQAKSAASYPASKVNLVSPGTYDLTTGVDFSWDATGWTGDGTKWLNTNLVGAAGGTFAVWFSGVTGGYVGGVRAAANQTLALWPATTASDRRYYKASFTNVAGAPFSTGSMAIAGTNCYKSGVADGTIGEFLYAPTVAFYIGAANTNPAASTPVVGKILAAGYWNNALTETQMAAIEAEVNAL